MELTINPLIVKVQLPDGSVIEDDLYDLGRELGRITQEARGGEPGAWYDAMKALFAKYGVETAFGTSVYTEFFYAVDNAIRNHQEVKKNIATTRSLRTGILGSTPGRSPNGVQSAG